MNHVQLLIHTFIILPTKRTLAGVCDNRLGIGVACSPLGNPSPSSESSLSEDELSLDSSAPFLTEFITSATLVAILSWAGMGLACSTPTDLPSEQLEEGQQFFVGFSVLLLLVALAVVTGLMRVVVLVVTSSLSLSEEE